MSRPRKRFGQHFLTDAGVIDAIVRAVAPRENDVVVEIGPGRGAITAPIAARCSELHAIEIDRDLAARLRTRFADSHNIKIHEADALAYDFATIGKSLRIVGNLPYNISTPLLFRLLEQRAVIHDMHFMLQKEVVDRMSAAPGSKAYGRLTIMLGAYFEVDALFDVDRSAFEPPPAVTSAVVRMQPLERVQVDDAKRLSTIVARAFSQRRKILRNALAPLASQADLEALDIDPQLRPENIAIDTWIALANRLSRQTQLDPDKRL